MTPNAEMGSQLGGCVDSQIRTPWAWSWFGAEVYFDRNDWWIGYYRGDTHHYVCLLPTLVIRWPR